MDINSSETCSTVGFDMSGGIFTLFHCSVNVSCFHRNIIRCVLLFGIYNLTESVYRWAMGWTMRVLRFDSWRGLGIFLFITGSRPALGPTQPRIQWVPGVLSLGVKRPGREADHSPPSSAKVKEWVELYLHSPNTSSGRSAQLKHRDNVAFTFTTCRHEVAGLTCLQRRDYYDSLHTHTL
jgi:hypothetical protein